MSKFDGKNRNQLLNILGDNGRTDPEIEPFPSWEMNEIGNCSALQFVQGIAVDTDGIMWVIDSGRIDTLSQGEMASNSFLHRC